MRAILLDALGTLIGFEPPAPHLQAQLRLRGYDVTPESAHAAIRAEIAYYRAHLDEGREAESLRDLRERCAAAMEPELPGIPQAAVLDALLASLRFFAYPDTVPALTALRAAGIRLVVVSNWDHSLHERLSETGLTPLLDGAIASAEVGAAKPEPAIFARALELAGTTDAWHVGDTPEADLDGARAAGLRGILIDRGDARLAARASRVVGDVTVIGSLSELIPLAVPR
jgi:putative hydrolase of the HAD superfamily